MKRIIIIALSLTVGAIGVFVSIPLSGRASCFRNGTVSSSIAQATVEIGKWVHHAGKHQWSILGISEQDLISRVSVVEVNGPAMTFEHPSTRYVTFRLSDCPKITEPITVGVHCGDTPNLGWIAERCLSKED
ncbi:MAG: hypothetical protein P1U53_10305 [Sulfitobacter sp.]|nr:hypothetical protein [Sulfitobacter sp.]